MFGLGFMTFAFFLGAGNIIFPPKAGMLAGAEVLPVMLGFLLTAVGLPLLGLFAVARAGGGIPAMTRMLPPFIGVLISVAIFIIIGPLIAAPRTALVAYELGVQPFSSEPVISQWLYSAVFFVIAALLSLYPGKLMDSVGKVLTPALIILLVGLGVSVLFASGGEVLPVDPAYAASPFTKGVLDGYNTMDALASIMFGMLIIDLLRKKGVTDFSQQSRYLVVAAVIAAAGLAFVYIALFMLGANFGVVGAANGGEILVHYVQNKFGMAGLVALAGVITLACLTTAVGLLSACSDYFASLSSRLSYGHFVIVNAVFCFIMANLELGVLIELSIPVLVAVYPISVALILYSLSASQPGMSRTALIITLLVSSLFGILEGVKAAGGNLDMLAFLPLFDQGLAWVIPVLSVLSLFLLSGQLKNKKVAVME
ncbi:branched-chain amino acid transport system II carrier protein [Oceanospirillum sp. D5]|uniref:Branched-chain amino acid transport system carrier protein n=2 Tax=Oceanospirillum sediminis TaxID=2760088 RepID=A0A839IQZ7_9GAMM|nr:branched-chain amino acid transport system II carrier protein [Oceanospirillum sediminis]MBB1487695.1 branched-chain amino acid transport system II carrier protein [Oceanospirillum sediminis]